VADDPPSFKRSDIASNPVQCWRQLKARPEPPEALPPPSWSTQPKCRAPVML